MKYSIALAIIFIGKAVFSQYSHADSLRGDMSGSGRSWWDVKSYELSVAFDEVKREISGSNKIVFSNVLTKEGINERVGERLMQIDLQEPLIIDSAVWSNDQKAMSVRKDGNAYFFEPPSDIKYKSEASITVYYHGKPREAVNPPWDGGVIWAKDKSGKPWITVACQGLGASVWYPCKDSQADEPETATMHFTCREDLVCVSNGRFLGKKSLMNNRAVYSWHVSSPINNYCIIPYIGDYVNIHEHYPGEKGMLELDYWVLRGNEEKAKEHFTDVPKTMEALEFWFGPYPFYEDGYKLIEAPHLGMEHQSAIAYGNKFRMGYNGSDLSGTGVGMSWDYIIVHESGHEWFGNNITTADIADMWVHEGFTDYSETLFTEYWFGKEKADRYIKGVRKNILNDKPVIGNYGVNSEGSGDMYYKGANMLHTIRQVVNNDSLFRGMLRGLNSTFYHKIVTTKEIEKYMSEYLKIDLSKVFDQYLREQKPPTLELKYKKKVVEYRWINTIDDFDMPVNTSLGIIKPTKKWQKIHDDQRNKNGKFRVDSNYYLLLKTGGIKF